MKGEKILRRFNKVCKNLNFLTITEIMNDFKKIDSFNNLDEEEKKILVDIMYKFNKLCIKFNIDKKKVMDDFKIETNTINDNIGLKNSLHDIRYKENEIENQNKVMKNKQSSSEEKNYQTSENIIIKNKQSSSEEKNYQTSENNEINIEIGKIQNKIIPVYKKLNNKNPQFEDVTKLSIFQKNELLVSLKNELKNLDKKWKKKLEQLELEQLKKEKEEEIEKKAKDEKLKAEQEIKMKEQKMKKQMEKQIPAQQPAFNQLSFFIENNNAPKHMPYENWFGTSNTVTETSTNSEKVDDVKECIDYLVNDKKLKLVKGHIGGGLFSFLGTTETNPEKSMDDLRLDEIKLSVQLEVRRIFYFNLLKLFKKYQLFMIEYTNSDKEMKDDIDFFKKILVPFNKDKYFDSLNIPNLKLIENIKNTLKYSDLDADIVKSIHTYNKKEMKRLKS